MIRETDFEILMLKPRWSLRGLVFDRSANDNKNSIMIQLDHEYFSRGWQLAADIGWGKQHKFAVVKLKRPTMN